MRYLLVLLVGILCGLRGLPLNAADPPAPDYRLQIAPILDKYCTACHNADDAEGDLSLESFADLQRGGEHGPAVLVGESKASRLIRVLTGEAEPKMPPEDSEPPSEAEIELLRAWIDAGAKGPEGAEPDRKLLLVPQIPAAENLSPAVTSIAVSPDGQLLAAARFATVELRDNDSGKLVRKLSEFPGKVTAVHFSSDGQRLLTASGLTGLYGLATLWDAGQGTKIREFSGHRDLLYDAELSPAGTVLATTSYDRKIILWNVNNGDQLRTLEGHNGAVYDLAFSPDGAVLASASGDETVKLWRVESGLRLDTLSQPQAEQYVVTFSPNGRFVLAGGADNRIRVWRVLSRTQQRINPLVYARFAHEAAVTALAFSRDGKSLISAGEDRTLKLWETKRYTQIHLYERQNDDVTSIAVAPTGESLLVGRLDGQVASYPIARPAATTKKKDAAAVATDVADAASDMQTVAEVEPNDVIAEAGLIQLPARVSGVIHPNRDGQSRDIDLFRFESEAGQQWALEVNASRQKSPLDSKIEVLDAEGNPVLRVLLRAVRDSYFTFRGQNSTTSDGFRLHNWEEMDLNEYLYASGEVVKLWHFPRGPDSGFMLYPGRGSRVTYFDTTATSHPLQAPCYIVEPHPPGTELIPNGLPVFPVYYENDDDSHRQLGADSRLLFTAPATGAYLARVSDARSFTGPDYKYELTIRPRRPDFKVTLGGANPTVNASSGKEFTVTAERIDGFEGEIRVDIEGLPPGFHVTTPLVIERGQTMAWGTINALPEAAQPTADKMQATKVTASAMIGDTQASREVNNFGEIKLAEKPKLLVSLWPSGDPPDQPPTPDQPLELVVAPGETITAKVRVERHGFDGRVSFGNADSGRNLPHGVYIDNIGLNGLLIVEGKDERTFFITAAKGVPETTRTFHLQAQAEGNQTSWPVILHVRSSDSLVRNE